MLNTVVKCSKCGKDMEIIPLYQKYLEEYLGMTVQEAIKKGIKFICQECKEEK